MRYQLPRPEHGCRYFWSMSCFGKFQQQQDVSKAAKRGWLEMGRKILESEQHFLFPLGSQNESSAADSRVHQVAGSTQMMLLVVLTSAVSGKSPEQRSSSRDFLHALLKFVSPCEFTVSLQEVEFDFALDADAQIDLRELLGSDSWRQCLAGKRSPFQKKFKEREQNLCDVLCCLRLVERHHDLLRQLLLRLAARVEIALDFASSSTFMRDEEVDEQQLELGLGSKSSRDMALRVRNVRFLRGQKTPLKLSSREKARMRAMRAKLKGLVTKKDRHRERALYWQAARRHLHGAARLGMAFDASRIGGRKRTTYILLHLTSGLAAWGPPQAGSRRRRPRGPSVSMFSSTTSYIINTKYLHLMYVYILGNVNFKCCRAVAGAPGQCPPTGRNHTRPVRCSRLGPECLGLAAWLGACRDQTVCFLNNKKLSDVQHLTSHAEVASKSDNQVMQRTTATSSSRPTKGRRSVLLPTTPCSPWTIAFASCMMIPAWSSSWPQKVRMVLAFGRSPFSLSPLTTGQSRKLRDGFFFMSLAFAGSSCMM